MKKVNLDKVEHMVSTNRCGKGNNKRYAFQDFSDLIDVRDTMRKSEPKVRNKPSNKIVKVVPRAGAMYINKTHVFLQEVGWVIIDRYMTPSKVRKLYPNVMELLYSIDNEVFGDWFVFNNSK